jgi:hypothetical protein
MALSAHSGPRTAEAAPQGGDDFSSALEQYLAVRWRHDRTAALDHIGSASYARQRREQLQGIHDSGYLARQYGLLTARKEYALSGPALEQRHVPGLTVEHQESAEYQRDAPSERTRTQCLDIYRILGRSHPSKCVLFANSQTNAARILAQLKMRNSASRLVPGRKEPGRILPLKSGLVAIELSSEALAPEAQKLVRRLGCQPSHFHVDKLHWQSTHPASDNTVRPRKTLQQLFDEERIDNHAHLQSAWGEDMARTIASLRQLPPGHAMQTVANSTASLLAALQQTLQSKLDSPGLRHDPLIANALDSLLRTAQAMTTVTNDSTLFFSAQEAIIEEMHLLLASVQPYGETDFKKATAALLERRCGPVLGQLQIAPPETFLLSSGMDAISTGVEMARKLTGTKRTQALAQQDPLPDYFETVKLHSKGHWYDQDRIRMAPLHPSWPQRHGEQDKQNDWSTDKLVSQTIAWVKNGKMSKSDPGVLVLDATLEQRAADGKSDLADVIEKLQPLIDSGQLKIVLCKSYQKYTSLGSGKIMAGAVTVIGRDDAKTRLANSKLREAEQDLGWINNDESQLLVHMLGHAQDDELKLIDEATRNAAFVDAFCLRKTHQIDAGMILREEDLPFLLLNTLNARRAMQILARQVELRTSFGFLGTSMLDVGRELLRLTVGRESREELVEKHYALGWMLEGGLSVNDVPQLHHKIMEVAKDAFRTMLEEGDVMHWGPTAIQIINKRFDTRGIPAPLTLQRCEAVMDELIVSATQTSKYAADRVAGQKQWLREELDSLLEESEYLSDALITDQIGIVCSAFAPRLSDAARHGTDVAAMRAEIQRTGMAAGTGEGENLSAAMERARYAPHAIASLLTGSALAFAPGAMPEEDLSRWESLFAMCLDSGLPGVSAETRAHILSDWALLHERNLQSEDPALQRAAAEEMLRHLRLGSYRDIGARIFAAINENIFAALAPSVQQRLSEALCAGLDVDARLAFIEKLAQRKQTSKLAACVKGFATALAREPNAVAALQMPDNLLEGRIAPHEQMRPLTEEKRGELLQALQSYQGPQVDVTL